MENKITAKGLLATFLVMAVAVTIPSVPEIIVSFQASTFAYFHPTHSTIINSIIICSPSENGCMWFNEGGSGGGWGRFGLVRL